MPKSGENILITGGAGYIGSHLMKMLVSGVNLKVVSLDNKTSLNQKHFEKGIFIKGDVGDRKLLCWIFKKYKINIVMHLASLIQIEESMRNPELYFKNNVAKGVVLLEAMRDCGIRNIIYASSAAVYGNPKTKTILESHEKNPVNFYGETKICFENLLEYFNKNRGLNFVAFRFFNVAGADPSGELAELHKPETHLIPLVLKAAFSKKPVNVFGSNYKTKDGTCVRDFVHVSDIARAFTTAIPFVMSGKSGIFNLGSDRGYSVFETIKTVQDLLKTEIKINWAKRREGDPDTLVANSLKAKKVLGWRPEYDLKNMVLHAKNSLYGKPAKQRK